MKTILALATAITAAAIATAIATATQAHAVANFTGKWVVDWIRPGDRTGCRSRAIKYGKTALQSYYGVKGLLGALVTEATHKKIDD